MKVNFNVPLVDFRGNVLSKQVEVVKNGKKCLEVQPEILKELVCQALYGCGDGLTGDEKYSAYKLGIKIITSEEEVDLKPEDGVLIKKICNPFLTAGAYGQLVTLIDGDE